MSLEQFVDPELVARVAGALDAAGLPGSALRLEPPESCLPRNPALACARLQGLKSLGLTVAIDDFGTGWSSLAQLRQHPVDVVKIDRCFVQDLGSSSANQALSRGVVALGRSAGLITVAEGVERPEQLQVLRELGCDYAQGFLLGRPTDTAGVRRLLRTDPAPNGLVHSG